MSKLTKFAIFIEGLLSLVTIYSFNYSTSEWTRHWGGNYWYETVHPYQTYTIPLLIIMMIIGIYCLKYKESNKAHNIG
jgi:hypothetical protein